MWGGPARLLAVLALAAALAGLSACGFRPVYGGAAAGALAGAPVSAGSEDRLGFLVANAVREQTGAGDSPYRIALSTSSRERGLGRAGDGRATRFALQVTVRYTLTRADGRDEPPVRGSVQERILFEAPNDPFALISARSQAEQRAAETLGLAVIRDASIAVGRARDPRLNP
ncbi:hypothetical protein FKB34_06145 [Glycocaulis profundi]|nr:hypothetical protein FKB34_06145 [Glycocaulis profundi]